MYDKKAFLNAIEEKIINSVKGKTIKKYKLTWDQVIKDNRESHTWSARKIFSSLLNFTSDVRLLNEFGKEFHSWMAFLKKVLEIAPEDCRGTVKLYSLTLKSQFFYIYGPSGVEK